MNKLTKPVIVLSALFLASLAILVGCATRNPSYNPQQPPSPTNEPYSVDPRLLSMSNQVAAVKDALAPVNPYAGITDYVFKAGFGLAGLLSGLVVGYKNRQAVINTMAAGVVKAGPQVAQTVLDHAATVPGHFTAIAAAINDNTGANQTATGATRT
ncbi:MAG TPA: hypothetical protein VNM37_10045 [Candidatus Dormibacteraeota bacterium]|nr:hypothetical protein [Candidatus Dormibacteraeota bacterium]